nr:RNA ligase family protein [Nocardia suismassiliense]
MLAVPGRPPTDGWAYEVKWDGARCAARCTTKGCRLYSRSGRNMSTSFPEVIDGLLSAAARSGHEFVVDGELVVLSPATGIPDFAALARRLHRPRPSAQLQQELPVTYIIFDVTEIDGMPVTGRTYVERRQLLGNLGLESPRLQIPPFWTSDDVDPEQLLAAIEEKGGEGLLSKRLSSSYTPGRSRSWIKTVVRLQTEGIVIGHLAGRGPHATTFGSLILGAYTEQRTMRWIGCVGTGFTNAARREIRSALDQITQPGSPLGPTVPRELITATWVHPVLVASIEYREVTASGILRHPSFRGIRTDIEPSQVKVPEPDW